MASKDRVLSEVQRLADGSLDGLGEKESSDENRIAHRALVILSDTLNHIWDETRGKKTARAPSVHDHAGVEAK
ncbi:hypothetical protein JRI60_52395 [Archangium violaceum]|uniref:hypothetical protein n=1 Tax=Archangium violaceum TaxID=83451 RepID=UPI00194F95DD|nr:hypothetical protein [Archangium violaceum]QRN97443.1 hypothetical protein JRI60_52395 [Archangium violaceum]